MHGCSTKYQVIWLHLSYLAYSNISWYDRNMRYIMHGFSFISPQRWGLYVLKLCHPWIWFKAPPPKLIILNLKKSFKKLLMIPGKHQGSPNSKKIHSKIIILLESKLNQKLIDIDMRLFIWGLWPMCDYNRLCCINVQTERQKLTKCARNCKVVKWSNYKADSNIINLL